MSTRAPTDTQRGRLQPLARLPVFFALDGRRAVLAGGSQAAAWKAELLSAAGAQVDVYANEIGDDMLMLMADPPRGIIVHHQRAWTANDFRRAAIAIGVFEDDQGAASFVAAARAAGVPVNVVDKPAFCDFSFGALVNRSPLVIGISTDGAAPVFAQAIRAKLEAMLPMGLAAWAKAASAWRATMQAAGLTIAGRRSLWQRFAAQAMLTPDREPTQDDLEHLLAGVTAVGEVADPGSVTLVGAGPGDAELLTLRAVRALQSADVILFDDLVSAEVLDFSRREARKMLVGKTGFGPSCKQEDINALMVSLAKQGKRVVRLKGGDPLIFARAGEELAACRGAGIAVEVVPGITAVQGAAARLALPLTGRGQARRLQLITGHARDGKLPDDIDWQALADPVTTTAIYMPARTLAALVEKATGAGLDPRTPAIAIARATRSDQQVIAGPVCDLPARLAVANMPGPVLVMIGQVLARTESYGSANHSAAIGSPCPLTGGERGVRKG
jgi:uroporphyrin-III C-methyltransferase/precorrin-2 dehydrogenase/sirohydrochlorin ferrochelatase